MTDETKIQEQKLARIWLLRSAALSKHNGLSMAEWMESTSVLNCCKEHEIPETVLEHVAQWVWKPIKSQ